MVSGGPLVMSQHDRQIVESSPAGSGGDLSIGRASHVGMVREANEDSLGMFAPDDPEVLANRGTLFVVADGMGGVAGGAEASRIAVDIVLREYFGQPLDTEVDEALRHAFERANSAVHQAASVHEAHHGMGTTATAVALVGRSATVAHVGDSRAYLVRDGLIVQLTDDHSLVATLVKGGSLTRQEAREHVLSNVITRCIGPQEEIDVDVVGPIEAWAGDRFVLCSDGLHGTVTNEEIAAVATADTPQVACDRLIAWANERGGQDNITVQIIAVNG